VRVTLEIAVSTPEEAVASVRAGADRLELSAGLEVGGLTPSPGVFARVRHVVAVPVYVLLRPRPGGFRYSTEEVEALLHDAEAFLNAGADGLVFGALDERGQVAHEPCRRLSVLTRGRIVFHRAFDFLRNPVGELDYLTDLGFERVLSSGGKCTAREGAATLAELVSRGAGRIEVMAAGGIRPENVVEVVGVTGCRQVHAAVRTAVVDPTLATNLPLAGAMGADALGCRSTTDPALVAGLRAALDGLGRS